MRWIAPTPALALTLLLACGGSMASTPSHVKITLAERGPEITWDRCEEFGTKRCGDKLKVGWIKIFPSDCTTTGDQAGARPVHWEIAMQSTFGGHFQPPIRYGVVPPDATVVSPAIELTRGCTYVVQLGVYGEGGNAKIVSDSFSW